VPDVFISYNREDRETARSVANALEAEGFSVWWDAALRAGETYDEVTEQNLRQAGAVVVLWSKRSANSKWVRAEATVGERASTLVPALIEDCDRPVRFELVQTADLTRWKGERSDPNWRAFVQDIKAASSRRAAGKPTAPQRAAAATSDTIETTFWNSIKDGSERSDFQAYLDRYPNGHFAALARNRIAVLDRQRQSARPAPTAAPVRPATQTAKPSPPTQAQRAATPQQRAAAPVQRPTQPEVAQGGGGANVLAIAGVAVVLLIGAAAAMFAMNGGFKAKESVPTQEVASTDSQPASQPAPAAASSSATGGVILSAPPEVAGAGGPAGAIEAGAAEDMLGSEAPQTEDFVEPETEAEVAQAEDGEPAAEAETAVAEPPAAEPDAVAKPAASQTKKPEKAKTFRDCEHCPLMAKLPSGGFVMGSPTSEAGRNGYEGPQRDVEIREFAIGVYEVTAAEWAACAAAGQCQAKRNDDGMMPALGVSWRDADAYVKWLSKETGRAYRLPTEAEWEYAARGGSTTPFWWGESMDRSKVAAGAAEPVGSYAENPFGLHDVLSNAREWVEDCYVNNYNDAPKDGSAVRTGNCSMRVIRGGAFSSPAAGMRAANRGRIEQSSRPLYMGVRVAAEAKK